MTTVQSNAIATVAIQESYTTLIVSLAWCSVKEVDSMGPTVMVGPRGYRY